MVAYLKTTDDFKAAMERSKSKLLVIDFTATWCGPCQTMAPIFEGLAAEFPNVEFVKVDVDDASEIAEDCGVTSMPTFQFFKGGAMVQNFVGANKQKLKETVEKLA